MKKSKMKSTTLRTLMSAIVVITILLAAVGFYYAQDYLRTFAVSISQTVSKSTEGNNNPQAITKLKEEIAEVQVAADKANNIATTVQDYQNQTVKDLNKYASNNGISITDYKFAPLAPSNGLIGIAQTGSITITLSNPITFANLMKFFKSIETNIPKMQITGISLTRDPASKDKVTVEPLTIDLYVR